MKIGIQTWGSNGDIRPMIALAHGLQQAGHTVTLIVSSLDNRSYADQCAAFNIQYQQIPEQIDFDLEAFAQQSFKMNAAQWLVALLDMAYFPHEQLIYQAAKELVSNNDLLIGHHFLYPLKLAALKSNKPFYSVTLCHAAIKNDIEAPFMLPNLGKYLNRLQWQLFETIFDFILKKKLTRLWNQEGMPKVKHVLSELLTSDDLNLIAVDSVFCPQNQQWQAKHQACGFLNLPTQKGNWQIDQSLQAFLDTGSAPVYMTFGSLQQAVPDWSMEIFIKATQLSGCRAIIQTSSLNYPENTQTDNIYFIGRHPHQILFRHCAAIVHHGGAGTTHSASLCGRPSIVVPFMDEQLFWAKAVEKLGIASKPLPAKKLNEKNLAEAIKTILSNPRYRDNAEKIGEQIKTNLGVKNAVTLIKKQFDQ